MASIAPPPRPKGKGSRKSSSNHRSTMSLHRTEVKIHVYDLLPPGKVSTLLWAIGSSLLHSGVVINDKEYAYGGHDQQGVSGVYSTKPGEEPPGGTFRHAILHGFSFRPEEELKEIILEASKRFQGTSYSLLTMNCNHFTSYLCEKLTNRPAPGWINRAASIGVALPCVVPRDWIEPPDHGTANGELLDEEEDHVDERSSMLRGDPRRRHGPAEGEGESWEGVPGGIPGRGNGGDGSGEAKNGRYASRAPAPRLVSFKDTDSSGRPMPAAERAPLPRRIT